ncbi:MAG: hypothetical protein ACI9Z3_000580 [Roseivirga sp.]
MKFGRSAIVLHLFKELLYLLQRLPTSLPLFDSYIVMVWQISAENTFDKRFIKGLQPFHKF